MQSIKVKVLTFFMSLVMAVSALPAFASNAATVSVDSAVASDYSYSLSTTGVLTIKGNGAMPDYIMNESNQTNAPWFSKKSSINKVVIGDGITHIGNNAFENCSGMSTFTIPPEIFCLSL